MSFVRFAFWVDIRTMQIIEKGSWDEVFFINGGGHVHMKLQFILSEEDRNRIRIMVLFSSIFSCNYLVPMQEIFFIDVCEAWFETVLCIVNCRNGQRVQLLIPIKLSSVPVKD